LCCFCFVLKGPVLWSVCVWVGGGRCVTGRGGGGSREGDRDGGRQGGGEGRGGGVAGVEERKTERMQERLQHAADSQVAEFMARHGNRDYKVQSVRYWV
jgi:hypothetical protein